MIPRSIARGFTLVEMLVAMAVSSVLMITVLQCLLQVSVYIPSNENRLFATNDAQAALDLISSDLKSLKVISIPANTSGTLSAPEILQAYTDPNGLKITPTSTITPQATTIYPMQLLLLASAPGSSYPAGAPSTSLTSSMPHLIRYQLGWQDPITAGGTNPILALYRDYISADDTYGSGTAVTSAVNTSGLNGLSDLSLNYWKHNGLWSGLSQPPLADMLVGNLIDFQILFYDVGGSTPSCPLNYPLAAPTSQYAQISSTTSGKTVHLSAQGLVINGASVASGGTPTPYTNLVAEIKLTILEQKGTAILNTGALNVTSTNLCGKYAHVYIRRVPLLQ